MISKPLTKQEMEDLKADMAESVTLLKEWLHDKPDKKLKQPLTAETLLGDILQTVGKQEHDPSAIQAGKLLKGEQSQALIQPLTKEEMDSLKRDMQEAEAYADKALGLK